MLSRYQPRAHTMTRYIAPAVASIASRAAAKAVYNSLPSSERVGEVLSGLYRGSKKHSAGQALLESGGGGGIISAPAAYSRKMTTRRPSLVPAKKRGAPYVITNREMISGSVPGSVAWASAGEYPLNPGMASTFPWLAPIARQYEEYRFRKLRFVWVPIAPTSTQGDVILVPDYDASNPAPISEVQAVNHVGTVIDSVWKPITMDLDPAAMCGVMVRKYVRSTATAGDIKTFDSGNFYIATNNETSAAAIGKLFVEYVVELYVPCQAPVNDSSTVSVWTNSIAQTFSTGVTTVVSWDTTTTNALGVSFPVAGAFVVPVGFWKIRVLMAVTDSAAETFTGTLGLYNNNALMAGCTQGQFKITNVANGFQQIESVAYVALSVPGSITAKINLAGAAGTLQSSNPNNTYIEFSVV